MKGRGFSPILFVSRATTSAACKAQVLVPVVPFEAKRQLFESASAQTPRGQCGSFGPGWLFGYPKSGVALKENQEEHHHKMDGFPKKWTGTPARMDQFHFAVRWFVPMKHHPSCRLSSLANSTRVENPFVEGLGHSECPREKMRSRFAVENSNIDGFH